MSGKHFAKAIASKGVTFIHGSHNDTIKHLVKLREKKSYRYEQGSVLVQGKTTIQELLDRDIKLRSIGLTVTEDVDRFELDRNKFPAERYYMCDINNSRRILGTASRPSGNEMFAEVELPSVEFSTAIDRLIVFNKISDPGNLGTLVRTAKALGWSSALLTDNTCDINNDKTIRASKGTVIGYPHKTIPSSQLIDYIVETMHMTPVVADIPPCDVMDTSSSNMGLFIWNNTGGQILDKLPNRIALILSSEHHGPSHIDSDILRVSIPMHSNVESLNVASAGSILLFQLNRLLGLSEKA
ncbi:Alpha/beta knot methyltransferase [Umbelopsis sp. PMI_123]|nr:Alpha/beta knot methyltransferase [Umbelopsis sp. PMI_123]